MKYGAVLSATVGLTLSGWLLQHFGFGRVMALLAAAGSLGFGCLIALHMVQMWFSALGWRAIAVSTVSPENEIPYLRLRWIRESVNNLLPLAQVGGEFVVARMLARRGMRLNAAIAGTVADLSMEVLSQILFTVIGLLALWRQAGPAGSAPYAISASLTVGVLAAGFFMALRLGIVKSLEKWLIKLGRSMGLAAAAAIDGVEARLLDCYASPCRVAAAVGWHMASWLLGAVEVCLALSLLDHAVNLRSGLIIESLGQTLKAAGFAVPGAVGIQEGGYVIICRAVGIGPEVAIALSLIKRLREIALGLPGMVAWYFTEKKSRLMTSPLSERFR